MTSKTRHWAIALGAAVCPLVLVSVVQAFPREPDYFCYQVANPEGLVNLNPLCAQTPPLPPKPAPSPAASVAPATVNPPAISNSTTPSTAKGKQPKPKSSTPNKPKPPQPSLQSHDIKPAARQMLDFSKVSYTGDVLTGSVKNKTNQELKDLSINYVLQFSKDKVNWKSSPGRRICLIDDDLPAGQTTEFKAYVGDADKVVINSVTPGGC